MDRGFLYGTFLMLDPWFAVFFLLIPISIHFSFFQENLIKEDKAANNNHSVLAAQSSPPEDDDDEAQADGPSQNGAPGDNSTLPNFSYKVEGYSVISSIGCGVSLISVF
jgi:hypothetical protein